MGNTIGRFSGVQWLEEEDSGTGIPRGAAIIGFIAGVAFLGIIVFAVSNFSSEAGSSKKTASGQWVSAVRQFEGIYEKGQNMAAPEDSSPIQSPSNKRETPVSQPLPSRTYQGVPAMPIRGNPQSITSDVLTVAAGFEETSKVNAYVESVEMSVSPQGAVSGVVFVANRTQEMIDNVQIFVGTERGQEEMSQLSIRSLPPSEVTRITISGNIRQSQILEGTSRIVGLKAMMGTVAIADLITISGSQTPTVNRASWP